MPPSLYKYDASPPARAVMMTAHILKLDLNMIETNPVQREQDTPELIKKNPMRSVPLFDEGDFHLADSHAIITYLLDKYGKAYSHLYPKDLRKRATINQRLFFDSSILFPRLREIMGPTFAGQMTEIPKQIRKSIDQAYRMMEGYLADSKYIADDVLTLADISVVSTVSSMDGVHSINETRFPKLKEWYNRMSQEVFFIKYNKSGSDELVKSINYCMERNKKRLKAKL